MKQIYNQNWYIVGTHSIISIPDTKEVENLTDLNVEATQKYYGLTNIRLQRQIS
jgi:hypothetical protein